MHIAPPAEINYGFYNNYILKAAGSDLITSLQDSWNELQATLIDLTEEDLLLRYEAGKWNIKEITLHLIDAERNFCYRAMRLSRKDQAALPVYDIHQFVANSFATDREMSNMLQELGLLRQASILMFDNMPHEMLDLTGPARDVTISVRALGFALAGHTRHHLEIIRERYLGR